MMTRNYQLLIIIIGLVLSLIFFLPSLYAGDITYTNNTQVSGLVLGKKPQVKNVRTTEDPYTPTGVNTGATSLNIIGYKLFGENDSNFILASLDDPESTILTGTATLVQSCDEDGNNCGSGSYDKVTGLSVPAGVTAGVYNVLITTNYGTNMTSDVKFTVTDPVPAATPSVSSITPSLISFMAGISSSVDIDFNLQDSDTATLHYQTDETITGVSTNIDTDQSITLVNNEASGSFEVSADGTHTEGVYSITFKIGDGGSSTTGNTASENLTVSIDPSW